MSEASPDYQIVVEPSRLEGVVELSGAKNSALKLVAASILTDEALHLEGFPSKLTDVNVMLDMVGTLGKEVARGEKTVGIHGVCSSTSIEPQARSVRTSLLLLAALIARYGEGAVPVPGGCQIGERKYDLHQLVLESLGARIWEENGLLLGSSKGRLKGESIRLPIRSTGATESALLAGSIAEGTTTIWNPHVRPEVLDLVSLLEKMGAHIRVYGQERIEIEGVEGLYGARHRVIVDNMEAFTFLVAAAVTDGHVEILGFPTRDLEVPLIFARAAGVHLYQGRASLIVSGGEHWPVEISTGPYPGINSDMQPLFAVLGSCAVGESRITDLRFPDRFGYVAELKRFGGEYKVEGNLLTIKGGAARTGATVRALDLRCGAALLTAGMAAKGVTRILNAQQIDRGYEYIVGKLQGLGGILRREDSTSEDPMILRD